MNLDLLYVGILGGMLGRQVNGAQQADARAAQQMARSRRMSGRADTRAVARAAQQTARSRQMRGRCAWADAMCNSYLAPLCYGLTFIQQMPR